tara:strand:- start:162 stop:821 length:660 start_codon:yes stop_codon:yes gene_type:complete
MPPEGVGYKRGGLVKGFLEDLEEMEGYAGGGPVKSFKYAEGGVVPSLSSGLFALSEGRPPVNVMDPYPGGSFEVPAFVPSDESSSGFEYEPTKTAEEKRMERAMNSIAIRQARRDAFRPLGGRDEHRRKMNMEREANRIAANDARRMARIERGSPSQHRQDANREREANRIAANETRRLARLDREARSQQRQDEAVARRERRLANTTRIRLEREARRQR